MSTLLNKAIDPAIADLRTDELSSKGSFRLMDLPLEIRTMIYKYYLRSGRKYAEGDNIGRKRFQWSEQFEHSIPCRAILQISPAITEEIGSMWSCGIPYSMDYKKEGFLFLGKTHQPFSLPAILRNVQSLRLHIKLDQEVFKGSSKLKSLVQFLTSSPSNLRELDIHIRVGTFMAENDESSYTTYLGGLFLEEKMHHLFDPLKELQDVQIAFKVFEWVICKDCSRTGPRLWSSSSKALASVYQVHWSLMACDIAKSSLHRKCLRSI
ncbi:hypothetical protein BT63DRAFT_456284 [Microthyrium microscopicum]|uniref:Uncharacterized protein n=1 Tax=Microthyrium microscopicum TaxID=703497 RepID=A0A6A6U8Z0_9PEZI|nr:hypothetical protein BT63DRAFT_456284 [Microthyrium microscopicum]